MAWKDWMSLLSKRDAKGDLRSLYRINAGKKTFYIKAYWKESEHPGS